LIHFKIIVLPVWLTGRFKGNTFLPFSTRPFSLSTVTPNRFFPVHYDGTKEAENLRFLGFDFHVL
jgi:hypothetical protein